MRAREGDLSETRDALQVSRDATAAAAAATERLSNELRASRLETENAREECVTLQRERDDVLRPTVDALRARIAAETKRKISVGALTRRCAALRRAALTSEIEALRYTETLLRDATRPREALPRRPVRRDVGRKIVHLRGDGRGGVAPRRRRRRRRRRATRFRDANRVGSETHRV